MDIGQFDLAAEERLLNEEMYRDLRRKVVGFVEELQAAATPEDWMLLHRQVLAEFGAWQDSTDDVLPRVKRETRGEIGRLARQEPKPLDEIKRQQEILGRVKRQELVARAAQHVLREVGDGIVWRALRYNRAAITVLGRGERVGRLASGIGRDAEFAVLGDLWENEGVFAIHNDMTNCMRHGDLTAIRRHDDGQIEITLIEVKAGERPSDTPQMRRLERATTRLREGRFIDDDGSSVVLTAVPGPYRTYAHVLRELIAEARANAFAWALPTPCLLVGAVDYSMWPTVEDPARRNVERRSAVGWPPGEPDTLEWTASVRRMRDRDWSHSALAPFTILPLPAEDVADLTMGFIDMATSLHLPGLEVSVARGGLDVVAARPPRSEEVFVEARRGVVGTIAPAHVREQMMDELMTVDSLYGVLDVAVAQNEQDAQPGRQQIITFEDETEAWEVPV